MSFPYDPKKLKTAAECRRVLAAAAKANKTEFYRAVFNRLCELEGNAVDDPHDPLVRAFAETLAAYEQLLTEKNGHVTYAQYTRRKINNKGVRQSLLEWTVDGKETEGFRLLVDKGLSQHTGEYLVVRFHDQFPDAVVTSARMRLAAHGIPLPA